MRQQPIAYSLLGREVWREAVGSTIVRGQGGPILFLWSVGLALLLLVLDTALLALLLTGATLALLSLAARSHLKDRRFQVEALRAGLERRFGIGALADPAVKGLVQGGRRVFLEMVAKAAAIEEAQGADGELRRVLSHAYGMLALQYESGRQAQELARARQLLADGPEGRVGPRRRPPQREAARLRRRNLESVEQEAQRARALVETVLQQLETLMLQIFQLERRTTDVVQMAEFARETGETLERLQQEVNLRRRTAGSVIDFLALEGGEEAEQGPFLASEDAARGKPSVLPAGATRAEERGQAIRPSPNPLQGGEGFSGESRKEESS